jgi:catechol 2,3-dioxygenase-like lactoylglutathione lyase family enzyme
VRALSSVGQSEPQSTGVTLDHVQVAAPAGCETEARRFYGELLGLSEIEKPPALGARGGVWFAVGGAQLHVGVAEPFTAAVKAHPAFRVDPSWLPVLADRLAGAGAPVQWPPGDEIPGVRRFFTADPWGNRLEVLAPE